MIKSCETKLNKIDLLFEIKFLVSFVVEFIDLVQIIGIP